MPEDAKRIRMIWFSFSSTIGMREHMEDRWLLKRRSGTCMTIFGEVIVKQVQRPNGINTLKPEFDEVFRLSKEKGIPIDQIRNEIVKKLDTFSPTEDWTY